MALWTLSACWTHVGARWAGVSRASSRLSSAGDDRGRRSVLCCEQRGRDATGTHLRCCACTAGTGCGRPGTRPGGRAGYARTGGAGPTGIGSAHRGPSASAQGGQPAAVGLSTGSDAGRAAGGRAGGTHRLHRDPRMDLVHLHGKVVFDALDGEVLSHRLELVADVRVVALGPPLVLEEVERLDQDGQGANRRRVGFLSRRVRRAASRG